MARRPRLDGGLWQHVSNHAVEGIAAFELEADVRHFFSLIAREVRKGRLRVYAFVVLSTHFHLLASSPTCELSRSLQRIETDFAQTYNRLRHRQGPVFDGRFWSKPVKTDGYRRVLVGYIDANPVEARLAPTSIAYPFGSARCYATGAAPRWLHRDWVESEAALIVGAAAYRPEMYVQAFGLGFDGGSAELVRRRMRVGESSPDRLDEFVGGGIERVRDWLVTRATPNGRAVRCLAVASSRGIERAIASCSRSVSHLAREAVAKRSAGIVVRVALLRDLGGCAFDDISRHLGIPRTTVQHAYAAHARAMRSDDRHALAMATLGHAAILATISPSPGP